MTDLYSNVDKLVARMPENAQLVTDYNLCGPNDAGGRALEGDVLIESAPYVIKRHVVPMLEERGVEFYRFDDDKVVVCSLRNEGWDEDEFEGEGEGDD